MNCLKVSFLYIELMWGSKKKKEYWNGPDGKKWIGKDAEDSAYYKAKLNPFNKVERHNAVNDAYDYKVKPRFGKYKMTKLREVKATTPKLTPREKELKKKHPRQFEEERINSDNVLHQARKTVRKLKAKFD